MKAIQACLICLFLIIVHSGSNLRAASPRPLVLVAYGDSLTAGYGLNAKSAFPAQLQDALKARGHNVRVHNAGVSGDMATGGVSRLAWSLPKQTDAVILELGANDALRGVDPDQTLKSLDQALQKLKARNVPVLLTGMLAPPNMGKLYGQKFNAIYPFLAKKYGVSFYPFFLKDVAAIRKLNQADGIHPNESGVRIIVKNILPHVEALLGSIKRK